ncbi:MAG: hypothetical protein CAK88_09045 [Verrucomicrobiia bacterium AMD-G2]|nr:MAG: hypothetical protein CAK88_09045 [Verrucomicrobiae bacterium AMD-G2]
MDLLQAWGKPKPVRTAELLSALEEVTTVPLTKELLAVMRQILDGREIDEVDYLLSVLEQREEKASVAFLADALDHPRRGQFFQIPMRRKPGPNRGSRILPLRSFFRPSQRLQKRAQFHQLKSDRPGRLCATKLIQPSSRQHMKNSKKKLQRNDFPRVDLDRSVRLLQKPANRS